jgi:hypothetical protein
MPLRWDVLQQLGYSSSFLSFADIWGGQIFVDLVD